MPHGWFVLPVLVMLALSSCTIPGEKRSIFQDANMDQPIGLLRLPQSSPARDSQKALRDIKDIEEENAERDLQRSVTEDIRRTPTVQL